MINSKEINSENYLIDKVKELYLDAFPSNERRDFDEFLRLLDDKSVPFSVSVLEEDGEFAGFLTFWAWDDFRYFEHFAVAPEKRNGGKGGAFLRMMVENASTPVVLEVELPEDEMAVRRIGFYRRNGFHLWDNVPYLQPSYGEGREPVPLCLMTAGDITFDGENDEKIRRIKREVYGVAE